MNEVLLAGGIFIITFALIVTERIDRTLAALLGGILMIILGVLSQEEAFHAIDWNVIFLLAGMMIIANVLRETGVFQWIAVKAVVWGKGDPFRIIVMLAIVTAITSALLDNVTIVILLAPVTLFVASNLKINPIPYLIIIILASNIGGAATLIGDPPNILIGSAANIDFLTFLVNLGPVIIVIMIFFIGVLWIWFRDQWSKNQEAMEELEALDTSTLLTDKNALLKSGVVMGLVMIGFMVHGVFHLEPATIALGGAVILLLWTQKDVQTVLGDIEWATLFFFIGLFIAVEGLVQVGIIETIGEYLINITGGNLLYTSMLLLWMSSLFSGIVDNIPYTATMIPVVQSLEGALPLQPLWWSLALGACLGGNATLVGASANVVVANIAARGGYPISFRLFLRYGIIITVISLVIASFYIWMRYL